jgi:hypothetical protein
LNTDSPSSASVETIQPEEINQAKLEGLDPPPQTKWVEFRCQGIYKDDVCGKLLVKVADLDGLTRNDPIRLGFDMKCRRCGELNYRVIVI